MVHLDPVDGGEDASQFAAQAQVHLFPARVAPHWQVAARGTRGRGARLQARGGQYLVSLVLHRWFLLLHVFSLRG